MAFTLTTGITAGAVHDASNPLRGGAYERIRLINWSDIYEGAGAITSDKFNNITAITLRAGSKQAWSFEGYNRSMKPKYELVRGAYSVGYIHTIDFVVFQVDYATKVNLMQMAYGKLVAVVENLDQDDEVAYEVYGLRSGLELITNIRDLNDADLQGGFNLQLATNPDGAKESAMPASWYVTSHAATTTAVEVLDTPTV